MEFSIKTLKKVKEIIDEMEKQPYQPPTDFETFCLMNDEERRAWINIMEESGISQKEIVEHLLKDYLKNGNQMYIKLTEEEGNRFIRNNKYRLEGNCFMDYIDYYNKNMMDCSNVYDKNWNKRIVIRKCVYDNYWDLNAIYKSWLNAPDVPEEKKEPLTQKQQIMVDVLTEAFDRWFKEDCEKDLKVIKYDNTIDFEGEYDSVYETIKQMKEKK